MTPNYTACFRQQTMLEGGRPETERQTPSRYLWTTRQPSGGPSPQQQQPDNISPFRRSTTSATSYRQDQISRSTFSGCQDTQRSLETRLQTDVQMMRQASLVAALTPSHLSLTSSDKSRKRALESGSRYGQPQPKDRNTATRPKDRETGDQAGNQRNSSPAQTRQPPQQSTSYG